MSARFPQLREEPGWFGMFTREQARGAIPTGTAIVKCWSEPGDAHEIGERGVVLGSIGPAPAELAHLSTYFYFVEWAGRPRVAVGCIDRKIKAVE